MNNPISNRPDKTLTPLLIPLFLHMAGASPPIYVPSEQITLQCGSSGPKYQNLFHSSTKQVVTNPYPKKHLLPLLPAKLDEKWVAKVSDFGMSKMGTTTMSKTHIRTAVKGSFGYLDPEYYRCQQLTVKSDVYSFGVVLCEVLCARPAVLHAAETRQMNLVEWTKSCHCDGELDQIIDPNMKGKIETECLNKYGEIAMSCINGSGMETLSMNDIVRGLEFALQLHQNCDERNKEDAFDSMPGCATNESVQCISETIFSEINDPNGR